MTLTFPFSEVEMIARDDGSAIIRSRSPLRDYDENVCTKLWHWERATPDAVFLAERDEAGAWRQTTYGEAGARVRLLAAGLAATDLGQGRPLLTLTANSVDMALIGFAAMAVGIPFAPVTPAYLHSPQGREKLSGILASIGPGLIVIDQWVPEAAQMLGAGGARILALKGERPHGVLALQDLVAEPTGDLADRIASVGRQHIAKIMMTSGSTGSPKGVIHTHGLMTSNTEMVIQMWPFLEASPMVMVDWLPWSHCFGSNTNLGMAYHLGGSYYIDKGRPVAGAFAQTIRNLTEIAPTLYLSVPSALAMLAEALEGDAALESNFFSRLQAMFFAGAGMPEETFERITGIARRALGRDLPMLSGWGATETGPNTLMANRCLEGPGSLGVPAPGVEIKLARMGDKSEIRVKSPSLTQGYWGDPELTAAAFDEEGYYRSGDAGVLEVPGDPNRGLLFDGRLSEDFKLDTGSWVSAGPLRTRLLADLPGLKDMVICQPNRPYIGLLVWPDADFDADALVTALKRHNQANPGRSSAIRRVVIERDEPSADLGEINAKGTINPRKVMQLRAESLEKLFAQTPAADVLTF